MKRIILYTLIFFINVQVFGQNLKPDFSKAEYIELLKLTVLTNVNDLKNMSDSFQKPEKFQMIYRSKVMGLDNRWDLWTSGDSIAAISIRGTTSKPESMLENFFSAMSPAKGELKISDDFTFNYNLSDDSKAGVHSGWLIALALLSQDIRPKLDSLYQKGIKDFYIVGYSQGGSIAYLLTSYFYQLQKNGDLASDIKFKTYCNAAPKPGNLFFAYDYERNTRNWAYNVVNAVDWVPQSPLSLETPLDMSLSNPFLEPESLFGKQKFPKNILINIAFKKAYNPLYRNQQKTIKTYGRKLMKKLHQYIPELETPKFIKASYYARCGEYLVMYPDTDYFKIFPEKSENVWLHHGPKAYSFLAQRIKE